jgi:hypothetical protein
MTTKQRQMHERPEDELATERLGRNVTDLLNELRVAGTGVQMMFAFLLIAPSVHHRLLFRQRERAYLVRLGTRLAIAAAAFLAVGLTGILVLISNFVFGTVAALCVGIAAAVVVISVRPLSQANGGARRVPAVRLGRPPVGSSEERDLTPELAHARTKPSPSGYIPTVLGCSGRLVWILAPTRVPSACA